MSMTLAQQVTSEDTVGPTLRNVGIAFIILEFMFVALWYIATYLKARGIGLDDIFMPLALVANIVFCVLCISKFKCLNDYFRLTFTSCSRKVLRWPSHLLGIRKPPECLDALSQVDGPISYHICYGLHFSEDRYCRSLSEDLFGKERSGFLLRFDCNHFFMVCFYNYCKSCSMHSYCIPMGTEYPS